MADGAIASVDLSNLTCLPVNYEINLKYKLAFKYKLEIKSELNQMCVAVKPKF